MLLAEATRYPTLLSLFSFLALTNVAGFAPMALFAAAQQQLERRWWRLLPMILLLSFLGAGMMLTTVRAALRALLGRRGAFERTPKFGVGPERRDWMRLRYQSPVDLIVVPGAGDRGAQLPHEPDGLRRPRLADRRLLCHLRARPGVHRGLHDLAGNRSAPQVMARDRHVRTSACRYDGLRVTPW